MIATMPESGVRFELSLDSSQQARCVTQATNTAIQQWLRKEWYIPISQGTETSPPILLFTGPEQQKHYELFLRCLSLALGWHNITLQSVMKRE